MMNSNVNKVWTTTIALVALSLSGCASDGPGDDAGQEEEHDPTEEACEHMADGPSAAHTASLAAPYADISAEHTRHDVTLVDDGGQNRGTVVFESGEAGDHLVFLSVDIPVAFHASNGDVIAAEEDEAVDACTEVARMKKVELPVGTVELRFGPTSETIVRVVIEEGGEDHDH